ncbi:MAG: DUF2442 domain-containing protein [Geobacter sp.]|nr:DUF2442 domain-containing protein [Geobacter sp.]
MNQQTIRSVAAESPPCLEIVWRSGKRTRVDVSEFLDSPGYESLKEPDFFATVAVEEWGHGVEWDAGLYRLGSPSGARRSVIAANKERP